VLSLVRRGVLAPVPELRRRARAASAPQAFLTVCEHPPQESQRARLVQRLVEVRALRRLGGGRAAALAGAARERRGGVADPCLAGAGKYKAASVSKVVAGRSSGPVSTVEPSPIALRWDATTCSVTATRPKATARPSRRSARSGSSIAVVVSFFVCVYQLPRNG